jgi:hypothetical protein
LLAQTLRERNLKSRTARRAAASGGAKGILEFKFLSRKMVGVQSMDNSASVAFHKRNGRDKSPAMKSQMTS